MADILIRGVPMPAPDFHTTVTIMGDGDVFWYSEKVGTAIPLPEGHGRLIDADALRTRMYETMDYQDLYLPIHFEMCMGDVPTIIEAEGGQDNGN